MEPRVTQVEAHAIVATKAGPKLTKEDIERKINNVEYLRHGVMTICIITMQNGFKVNGESACVSVENFDADVGQRVAYDNAFNKLWPLEGYLLRTRIQEGW